MTTVQMFIDPEVTSETEDMTEAARQAAEEMGLSRQITRERSFTPSEITRQQRSVYETLFPTKTDLELWDSPIPARILEVLPRVRDALKLDGHKLQFVVWSPESAQEPDPVLVAVRHLEGKHWEGRKVFLVARWGDALEDWALQVKQAAELLRSRMHAQLAKVEVETKGALAKLKHLSDDAITRLDSTSAPYFSSGALS